MSDWLIIIGMVLATYPVRLSVIALMGERPLPGGVNRALRYVPRRRWRPSSSRSCSCRRARCCSRPPTCAWWPG
jgi:hypothetical protein